MEFFIVAMDAELQSKHNDTIQNHENIHRFSEKGHQDPKGKQNKHGIRTPKLVN